MKTARDFLFNQDISPNELDATQISHIIAAINAARKEAIKECAKNANAYIAYGGNNYEGEQEAYAEIDKQSILKIIDELK